MGSLNVPKIERANAGCRSLRGPREVSGVYIPNRALKTPSPASGGRLGWGARPDYIPNRSRTTSSAAATCDGAVPPGTFRDSSADATVVPSTSASNSGENAR